MGGGGSVSGTEEMGEGERSSMKLPGRLKLGEKPLKGKSFMTPGSTFNMAKPGAVSDWL